MTVNIELTPESRECLMRQFKEHVKPYLALQSATREVLEGVAIYSFECDEVDANVLLAIAADHCPLAVKDIQNALRAETPESRKKRSLNSRNGSAGLLRLALGEG